MTGNQIINRFVINKCLFNNNYSPIRIKHFHLKWKGIIRAYWLEFVKLIGTKGHFNPFRWCFPLPGCYRRSSSMTVDWLHNMCMNRLVESRQLRRYQCRNKCGNFLGHHNLVYRCHQRSNPSCFLLDEKYFINTCAVYKWGILWT